MKIEFELNLLDEMMLLYVAKQRTTIYDGKIDYNEVAKDLLHVELRESITDDFYEMYGDTGIRQCLTKVSIAINKAIEENLEINSKVD